MTLQDPTIITHTAQPTAVVRRTGGMEELRDFYDSAYGAVAQALGRQGVAPAGAAFGYYLSMPTERFDLEAGFPTAAPISGDGDVVASELPAGVVACGVHAGGFEGLGDSWGALMAWVAEQGRTPEGRMWEVYVTEPTPDSDPETMRTELYLLLTD
ncbi:GyrI-like domain-containing protein [Ornithinimicrobium sp. F0845]|uniref:GyrI-like domain-containing protein n=1 Tax=Ornithinimicrobium sp. F0845 TaxID=2926412 RepID=UPI001FF3F066|nr:GyrI-like domain-containing protein [Ornithinimicrobium sp. F0845]MCK0112142.1 GyrI-like domain-containing protein [Ornithinimicrobium sp. F0845]